MVPGQDANSNNLGNFFSIYYTIINEAILMSTHNIQFQDKEKSP